MTAPSAQLPLFQSPYAVAARRRKRVRLAPHEVPPLEGARDRAAFVRRCLKEYYDAKRSEASCRSTAKHATLTPGEQLMYRERADFHGARAERVVLTLTRHSTFPEIAP